MFELTQIQTVIGLEWLLGTAIVLTIGIVGAWIDMRLKVAQISTKQEELGERFKEEKNNNKSLFERISDKLDKILENQVEVKVQLERKEDKK